MLTNIIVQGRAEKPKWTRALKTVLLAAVIVVAFASWHQNGKFLTQVTVEGLMTQASAVVRDGKTLLKGFWRR